MEGNSTMNDTTTLRGVIRSARENAVAADLAAETAAAAATAAPAAKPADATPAGGAEAKGAPKFTVYKADTETGVIYTFASAAAITDADKEAVPQADLIAMAHGFCASKGRAFNANHGQDHFDLSKAELVESIVGAPILKSGRVMKLGEELPKAEDDPVVGMNIEKGAETHWLIGFKPNNEAVVEEAKKGGVVGASWEGFANKVEVK
jgi:hypothetical protein